MDKSPRARILRSIGQLGAEIGLNRIAVQLYALLYLSEEPVSLDDMARALAVSKAAVSINVRALERWGAARRVAQPGSRRDHYEAERDVVSVVLRQIQQGAARRLDRLDSSLPPTPPPGVSPKAWNRMRSLLARGRDLARLPLAEMAAPFLSEDR